MKRLELLVVQIDEAKRMIEVDRIPQLRLAYILLDNAAEVILHRSTKGMLDHKQFLSTLLTQWKSFEAAGFSGDSFRAQIDSLEKEVLSKREIKEIERNFDAKVAFMISIGQLPNELAPVLKKLHQYRNEIYHRDKLRHDLIRPAVLVYFDIVCTMLEHYSQFSLAYGSDDDLGPELLRHIEGDRLAAFLFRMDLPKLIASRLREELGLDMAVVRNALAAYLIARLGDMARELVFIEENLEVSGLMPGDALLLVQADLSGSPTLEDIRSRQYRYSAGDLDRWKDQSLALEEISDKITMFAKYASIEDEFEPLEILIKKAAQAVDREVQLQIDMARGK